MGNSSTTSDMAPANSSGPGILPGNGTHSGGNFFGFFGFSEMLTVTLTVVINHCHTQDGSISWHVAKAAILLTALPANAALMWLLLARKKSLTPSEVLGLNVAVMDVLYCLSIPLEIYTAVRRHVPTLNVVSEALFSLNILGCPLLLASMCVERYVAAAHPVAYMGLRRWEHRWAWCAAAWLLTAAEALCTYFFSMFEVAMSLALTTSLLFLLMLLCLMGIVRVLRRSGPAGGSGAPLKRRALRNVLLVMVPSVVAYCPLVALVPYMAVVVSGGVAKGQCRVLQLMLTFPNAGLFIGPMFYMSRLTQWACWKEEDDNQDSKTLAD